MAAALECWSSRASSADEDMVEQVLMRSNHRSEAEASASGSPLPSSSNGSKSGSGPTKDNNNNNSTTSNAMQKRLQRLSRNVSEALASLKNTLNLESSSGSGGGGGGGGGGSPPPSSSSSTSKVETGGFSKRVVWASVIRSLTQLYPGSQLPDKLVSNIRKHYDSLPLRFVWLFTSTIISKVNCFLYIVILLLLLKKITNGEVFFFFFPLPHLFKMEISVSLLSCVMPTWISAKTTSNLNF